MEQNGPQPDSVCYDAAIAACEMSSQFAHAVGPVHLPGEMAIPIPHPLPVI